MSRSELLHTLASWCGDASADDERRVLHDVAHALWQEGFIDGVRRAEITAWLDCGAALTVAMSFAVPVGQWSCGYRTNPIIRPECRFGFDCDYCDQSGATLPLAVAAGWLRARAVRAEDEVAG